MDTPNFDHEKILILDFGSQFTQLIARRIRELGVLSEIVQCSVAYDRALLNNVRGIIFSGGPASVDDPGAPAFDGSWFDADIPQLGICYGMQLMAKHYNGVLGSGARREYGKAHIIIDQAQGFFETAQKDAQHTVWMSHGDHVESAPAGFTVLAHSASVPVAAMMHVKRRQYALQFHPEVVHSEHGTEYLRNFLFAICGCAGSWRPSNFIEETVVAIRAQVRAGDQVVCGLSGGVDSAVAAVLVHRALGHHLHCILVDNGLLRQNEASQIIDNLGRHGFGIDIKVVDAKDEFLSALRNITDPEEKRKTIGRVFIEVFEREALALSSVSHLVQGTLYPDVIESVAAFGPSTTIKSHHNVGGLPERMSLSLIEPFRFLFKDEVRRIGRELGMPDEILYRQPFPGPGLAVRILGPVTSEDLEILRHADAIFKDEIVRHDWYRKLWQSFAVLLPIRSVGVMGDGRTYEKTIALRAVHSDDGMTADWAYLPRELLDAASSRIINEVLGVNRVVFDISSKPPATIEWE